MAIKVKSSTDAANRWGTNAGAQSGYYASQAKAAGEEWASKTAAAKDTYGQAITSGNLAIRYAAGVAKAGAAKYVRKITDVGGGRYAPGVSAGKADYQANVDPFLSTIASLTLDAPAPRGDVRNNQRSAQVGAALHAKRLAMLGVS